MQGNFNIPSVDHLIEGVDYTIVDWDFADGAPTVPHTPGEPCPPGFKMVFGVCRKLRNGSGDWSPNETDREKDLANRAQSQGSNFQNNKAVTSDGKKFGWAMKGGKPVIVEWGSVAGEKKVGPKPSPTRTVQPSNLNSRSTI